MNAKELNKLVCEAHISYVYKTGIQVKPEDIRIFIHPSDWLSVIKSEDAQFYVECPSSQKKFLGYDVIFLMDTIPPIVNIDILKYL